MSDEKALARKADADLSATPFTYRTLREIAQTEFVPRELRGRPDAILAAIYMGRELGIGPMEALNKLDVIDGRPAPSAELLTALVFRAGHRIWPSELTETSATATAQRYRDAVPDGEPVSFTFTMQDAQRAGLAQKGNFKKYPKAMLYWRAASQLIRFMFPDAVTALKAYTADELGDDGWVGPDPEDEPMLEATPIPASILQAEEEDEHPELEVVDDSTAPFEEAASPSPTSVPPPSQESPSSTPSETESVKPERPNGDSSPASQTEALEAVTDAFPDAEVDDDPEAKLWRELLTTISGADDWTANETREGLEARVRGLCYKMEALDLWRPNASGDSFHRALRAFGDKDGDFQSDPQSTPPAHHWADLRVKAHMQRFARFVVAAAKGTIDARG